MSQIPRADPSVLLQASVVHIHPDAYIDSMQDLPSDRDALQALLDFHVEAGVDLAVARRAIASGAFDLQLHANAALASELGISGTPGWVVGDRTFNGAVPRESLGEAIEEARRS